MLPTSQAWEFKGGWLRKRSSEEAVDDVGHCILLVLHRCRDREEFLMGVVNTGTALVSRGQNTIFRDCCPSAGRIWNDPMPWTPSKLLRSERDNCWILSFRVWDEVLNCAVLVFEHRTENWTVRISLTHSLVWHNWHNDSLLNRWRFAISSCQLITCATQSRDAFATISSGPHRGQPGQGPLQRLLVPSFSPNSVSRSSQWNLCEVGRVIESWDMIYTYYIYKRMRALWHHGRFNFGRLTSEARSWAFSSLDFRRTKGLTHSMAFWCPFSMKNHWAPMLWKFLLPGWNTCQYQWQVEFQWRELVDDQSP